MKYLLRTLTLITIILLNGCASQTLNNTLVEPTGEERRILVTFTDRTLTRVVNGNSQDAYKPFGNYRNSDWSERLAQTLAKHYKIHYVAQWPVTELGVSCVVFEVPNTLSLAETIEALKKDEAIQLVQPMQEFRVLSESQSKAPTYSDPYLGLQSGFQSLSIAEAHKISTGRGVRIAVIDTGVDIDHPDLKGQIHHWENLAPEPKDHNLADKHGTAVAGILSARPNNGIGIAGITPDAEVLAFRACWPEQPGSLAARCNSFTLALALNQALRMKSHIINLSLSGPEDPLLKLLIEKALSKDIKVVAAISPDTRQQSFPANMPGVIAVGTGNEQLSQAIFAPGRDILTTIPQQAYDFMTGSSFATPHVAGLIALILQVHPDWQEQEIRQQLHKDLNIAFNSPKLNPRPN